MFIAFLFIITALTCSDLDAHSKFDKRVMPSLSKLPLAHKASTFDIKTFSNVPRAAVKSITKVPIVIEKPGYYTVDTNLDATFGVGIGVYADNVTLDFKLHTLTLSANCTGLLVANSQNVTIKNPIIITAQNYNTVALSLISSAQVTIEQPYIDDYNQSPDSKSTSLEVDNSQHIVIRDGIIRNSGGYGAYLINSSDITLDNMHLSNFTAMGLYSSNIQKLTINNSYLEGNEKSASSALWLLRTNGLQVADSFFFGCVNDSPEFSTITLETCQNSIIRNCTFAKQNKQNIHAEDSHGITIEKCSFEQTNQNWFACIGLYGSNTGFVRNCVMNCPEPHRELDAIIVLDSVSIVLENNIINMNASDNGASLNSAGISIHTTMEKDYGLGDGVLVKNCTIRAKNKLGVYSHGVWDARPYHNVLIDACKINECLSGIHLSNVACSTINNCSIKNCSAYGISIINNKGLPAKDGRSIANTISNCSISCNGKDGIYIEPLVAKTLIKANDVFNNAGTGISANKLSHLYNNITYANGVDTVLLS